MHAITVLGYLPKLKRSLGLAFFIKNVPHLILNQSIEKVSMSQLIFFSFFSSQNIKQNVLLVLIWLIDVINFKIYLQSSSKATADREKKRGEDRNSKL